MTLQMKLLKVGLCTFNIYLFSILFQDDDIENATEDVKEATAYNEEIGRQAANGCSNGATECGNGATNGAADVCSNGTTETKEVR